MSQCKVRDDEDQRWERACCGEGACSRSTAQQSQAFGGASHPSASKLARHSKPAHTSPDYFHQYSTCTPTFDPCRAVP
ncbi:hypothetical protein CER19_03455 [Pseudomonas sp. GL93]|nr:hypothetical protein CER19_03455 [Pseudomonas sp. GL93]